MPITKSIRIGSNAYLPVMAVTEVGIELVDSCTKIRWANFEEFIEMLHAAKDAADALGIRPTEKGDGNA